MKSSNWTDMSKTVTYVEQIYFWLIVTHVEIVLNLSWPFKCRYEWTKINKDLRNFLKYHTATVDFVSEIFYTSEYK